ncbi:cadherin-89D [Caerostris extrusa]|uniref:Cadherin-89D n=1 Tax=Caerostris extrusa TaxID=172846 RepID=A0AAV4SIU7_CAEEX|nr:cadherin-89D [Caerostris extrusa]
MFLKAPESPPFYSNEIHQPQLTAPSAAAYLRAFCSVGQASVVTRPLSPCLFYPLGENRRFERVEENIAVGSEVFRVQVYPRHEFKLEPVDNSLSDINFFRVDSLDNTTVSIKVARSLEDLVDRRDPQTVLKFKLTCKGGVGTGILFFFPPLKQGCFPSKGRRLKKKSCLKNQSSTEALRWAIIFQDEAFLPVTVYIQDINDHAPEFQNTTPYYLEVDELTPVGLTVFRGLHAIDKDKPNTPNSDVTYSIVYLRDFG